MKATPISRRQALQGIAAATVAASATNFAEAKASPLARLPLGLDAHAVRGMKWKSLRLIEYAARHKVDAVLFNGPQFFESLDTAHLKRVKAAADAGGLASTHYWVSPKDKLVVVTMEQTLPYSFLLEFALKGQIYDAILK